MRIIHVLALATLAGSTGIASARPVVVDGGSIEGVAGPAPGGPPGFPPAGRVGAAGGSTGGAAGPGLTVSGGPPSAAPPIGAQRWREPQPVKPWSSVRRAEAFAPACMQTGVSMPGET